MNTLTTCKRLALAAAIGIAAPAALAGESGNLDLAACEAEVKAYFGEATEIELMDRRPNPYGTRVRVAARLDADNSYFASCWVPRQDDAAPAVVAERGDVELAVR